MGRGHPLARLLDASLWLLLILGLGHEVSRKPGG